MQSPLLASLVLASLPPVLLLASLAPLRASTPAAPRLPVSTLPDDNLDASCLDEDLAHLPRDQEEGILVAAQRTVT